MLRAATGLPLVCQRIPFTPPHIESVALLKRPASFIQAVIRFLNNKSDGVHSYSLKLRGQEKVDVLLLKQGADSYILDSIVAGKGRYGKIKWALRLSGKGPRVKPEWVVIKEIQIKLTDERQINLHKKIDSEYAALERMGQAIMSLTVGVSNPAKNAQRPRKRVEQRWLIMQAVKGKNLAEFLESGTTMTAIDWLLLAEGMAAEVSHVHSKKLIHRDIKLENFMFDYLSRLVRLVDFGDAVPENNAWDILVEGTLGYDAPEVSLSNLESRVKRKSADIYRDYSKATDIYALGKTFKKLFGFEEINWGNYHKIQGLYNPHLLSQLEGLFNEMTSADANKRPALAAVISRLKAIRGSLLNITYATVGIIDVDDCISMMKAQPPLPVIPALRAVNEVILIAKRNLSNTQVISTLKAELEMNGINVRDTVYFHSGYISPLRGQLEQASGDQSPLCIRCFCHFLDPRETGYPENEGINNIEILDSKVDNQKQVDLAVLQGREVLSADKIKVIRLLKSEVDRLDNRWWPKTGTGTLSRRLIDINRALYSIENSETPLKYKELFKTLDNLQAQMTPTMECLTWLLGIFGYKRTSRGAANIAAVRNEIVEGSCKSRL